MKKVVLQKCVASIQVKNNNVFKKWIIIKTNFLWEFIIQFMYGNEQF